MACDSIRAKADPHSPPTAITTANGQPILRVNGKAMSFAGRKDFYAINGALVYTLRKQHVALLPQYFAKVSDGGERLFTVKSKFKSGSVWRLETRYGGATL